MSYDGLPFLQRLLMIRPCSGHLCPGALGKLLVEIAGRVQPKEHQIKAWQGPTSAAQPEATRTQTRFCQPRGDL